MRFEKFIEVDAPPQRLWDVLSDIEAWPRFIQTVEAAEMVTPPPVAVGSSVRLRQPKLPEGVWDITAWDPPVSFEWTQQSGGVTIVADHRVDAIGEGGSGLTLRLEMRGLVARIVGPFYKKLTQRYLEQEAQAMKRAAEAR